MEYSVKITNQIVLDAFFKVAKENGIEICKSYERDGVYYPYFAFREDDNKIGGNGGPFGSVISLDEMLLLISDRLILKLTSDYTAHLDVKNQTVNVGCQKIPFKTVLKLAGMVEKAIK